MSLSSKPYICPHCMIDSQNKEIVCLRNEIASLHTTISDMIRSLSQSQHNIIVSETTVSNPAKYSTTKCNNSESLNNKWSQPASTCTSDVRGTDKQL